MNRMTILAILLCVSSGSAVAETASPATPATKVAAPPGAVLSQSDCQAVWNKVSPKSSDFSQQQAQPYVTDFKKVDANGDVKISSSEFQDGCKNGLVHQA